MKLVDFGIAMAQSWEALTAAGHVGTFSYLPPEIFRGERATPQAIDVYSFGQCLHEALTGARPFAVASGMSPAAVAAAVGARKLQHGRLDVGEEFPQALREEIWRATDPDPARRTTMRALREVLEPLRELVAGPAAEPLPPVASNGPRAEEHTTRVPDPPGPAYSERPPEDLGRAQDRSVAAAAASAACWSRPPSSWPACWPPSSSRRAAAPPPNRRRPAPPTEAKARPDVGQSRGRARILRGCPPGKYRMGCTPGDAKLRPGHPPLPGRRHPERLLDGHARRCR